MFKMKFVIAALAALIATSSFAGGLVITQNQVDAPGSDKEHSDMIVLDVLSRTMNWSITNSTGYNLSLGFYSRSRNSVWVGFKLNNNLVQSYAIKCQSGENICYGLIASNGTYWGVGSNKYSCTNCCWVCGEADPSVNLTP
jgi:hypothetical protein